MSECVNVCRQESAPRTALRIATKSMGNLGLVLALALGFVKVLAGSVNHSEVYLIFVLLNLKFGVFFMPHIYPHKCQTF